MRAAFFALLTSALPLPQLLAADSVPSNHAPNIVLILADDLGYGDVGCYNRESKVPTPNIDRLASEGMRFTDAHSPATVCTPTRYSLMTGQMAFRVPNGGTVFTGAGGPSLIAPGRLTLPAMLKKQGYATAAVGKWHIGWTFRDQNGAPIHKGGLEEVRRIDFSRRIEGGPIDHGFDRFFGTACCPTTDWLYAFIDGDRIPVTPTGTIDKSALPKHPYANDCRPGIIASDFPMEEVDMVFLNKSRAFLEEHVRTAPNKPFFLYHAAQAVHLPSFPGKDFKGKTRAGPHGDFIFELDHVVGELMKDLERLGVADNTLVIFTSDNGPETTSVVHMRADHGHDGARPWRGVKRDDWEGGHRVPFIVSWPARVKAGTVSNQLTSLTDVMATVAAITGATLPADAAEDSFNMLPVLEGKAIEPVRPYLLEQAFAGARTLSIRRGVWKYLDHRGSGGNNYDKGELKPYELPETAPDAPAQLYKLDTDPGETTNLYFKHPEIVAELKGLLEKSKSEGRSAPRSITTNAGLPRDALPLDAAEWPMNYRIHLEGAAKITLSDDLTLSFDGAKPQDIAVEHPADGAPVLRVWSGGKLVRGPEDVISLAKTGAMDFPEANLDLGSDFTAMATFESSGQGTLFSMCPPTGKWSPAAKALFIRGGRLVYDIGWVGAMTGGPKVNDGKPHTAVLTVRDGAAQLWLDSKIIAEKSPFTAADKLEHVFKVGRAAHNFAGDFINGKIGEVKVWKRALPEGEIKGLFKQGGKGANTPDFAHVPKSGGKPRIEGGSGWVQALERSDHAAIVGAWSDKTLEEGAAIYKTLCVVCHGTKEQPGSLPTALRFAEGQFKNGSDPFSMYLTLTKGFGQMVPQPQYTTAQKYAVIHYIRETFLRPHNPSQLKDIDLASLPRGLARAEEEKPDTSLPPYQRMELGNSLFWTLEVAPDNIAQKGIAIRLDDGPGGVTKGRAWMIYDHDTMRVATATTGSFVDWKGIAFDGSHGTHTSLTGERHFINPTGPGWSIGGFEDKREPAKDGKKYGPHPGLKFLGLYKHLNQSVIAASIHGTRVLESFGWIDYGTTPVFVRTVNIAKTNQPLFLRLAPDSVNALVEGDSVTLNRENGFWVAKLPSGSKARFFISRLDQASIDTLANTLNTSLDLEPLIKGGPSQWPQTVTTTSVAGNDDGPFAADDLSLPLDNPFQSWLRPGGFDFTPDGKAAIVAMWNGDVWRVDGVMEKAPAKLTWRRIASGLFQPLGVKFRGDELFITCRDQLARLRDLNGDGETDFIECFNDDAQVTEHFHEFAMGLQTDDKRNFYYAKSGRHALDSVVPQHGTLLKVSADGSKTEILATGFRAANGVCFDGNDTFFVTDQEGFWTPKNRINRVKPGGFYGNMYGYTSITDTSDSAMEQPMVWITNDKDRSPAELLRVPPQAWGNLSGSLLNLSYGTGRAFIVPHEEVNGQWQGAVCELPMPAFATGIMRGRFGSDEALYTCGMFAWAGNATAPGGFHRIRRTGKPAQVPLAVHAMKGGMRVTFSDPFDPKDCALKIWSLKRTKNYGSKHYDEHALTIRAVNLSEDKCTVTLDIPDLVPTQCYQLKINDRLLHGTIHQLALP
ncbi:sulfatase-like hydrolase/transferase [Prosthecobacter sp.]|uniref:sulfatase-like hydrolase/transferase n=1 Tax=Prosthecobacter sp. TaxID=1965333 RepID=UPI001D54B2A6|nr:sulfatase-like hydrolase/transferase [Prosthecobacter sp.]MCB1275100.1 sulfatase-like hydrolase/transferase [Prosthecobacter sp.]